MKLSTDVSNYSRHSISSNHDAGVGNNNYIDLNVWDNSLAATTLGTYNAARFHINFTQFGGNRYVYINDVIIDRNVYNHIFTPLNVFHQTAVSSTVLNDNLPVLTLARQGTSGQAFGARATFKISRWENNSTNSRTKLNLDLSNASYDDVNVLSIRSDGNVGIGKDNPTQILQVGNAGRLRISNGISDYSLIGTIDSDGATNTRIVISGRDRGGSNANGNIEYISTGTAGQHIFYTTDSTTERFKIYNSGGVNVTGDYYKNGSVFIPANAYNLTGSPNITVGTIRASGVIASVNAAPWDHVRMWNDGATAYFDAGGAESGIAFRLDSTASGYPAPSYPEMMRITTSGRLRIANTAPLGTLSVGNSNVGGSDGTICVGKNNGAGGTRHCLTGYDSSFYLRCFCDYGSLNGAGTWTGQVQWSYACGGSSFLIYSNSSIYTAGYISQGSDQALKNKY